MQRIRDTFRRRANQSGNRSPESFSTGNLAGSSLEQQAKAELFKQQSKHQHRQHLLNQQQQQLKLNRSHSGNSTPTHNVYNQHQQCSRRSSPSNSVSDDNFWFSIGLETSSTANNESTPRQDSPMWITTSLSENDQFNFDVNTPLSVNQNANYPPSTLNTADTNSQLMDNNKATCLEQMATFLTDTNHHPFVSGDYSSSSTFLAPPLTPKFRSTSFDDATDFHIGSLNLPDNQKNSRSKSFDSPPCSTSATNSCTSSAPTSTVSTATPAAITNTGKQLPQTANKIGNKATIAQQNRSDSIASNTSVNFLDVPKWKLFIRRSSSSQSNHGSSSAGSDSSMSLSGKEDCAHCMFLNEWYNEQQKRLPSVDENEQLKSSSPETVDDLSECLLYNDDEYATNGMSEPTSAIKQSLEHSESSGLEAVDEFDVDEFIEPLEGLPIVTLCPPDADSAQNNFDDEDGCGATGITVVSLEVPILELNSSKQARSASVDSPYLLQVPKRDDIEICEGPPKARSKSVDIVLPTRPGGPYLLIPPRHPPTLTK